METNVLKVIFITVTAIFIFVFVWCSYIKIMSKICNCKTVLSGKIVIVTGANTGIGFETAKDLAKRDAKVILACRDMNKGLEAEKIIKTETGNTNVHFKQLDLASFLSVARFAEDIIRTQPFINILINNAGMGKLDNSLTEDNIPIEVQVNHYGPFLLTLLLLPLIKRHPDSRIVNVSSIMHYIGKVDPDNFHKKVKTSLQHRRLYSDTKLANMLFTLKLNELLHGSYVTVNCLHPGAVYTDIFRHQPYIMKLIFRLLMKSSWQGAQTVIHLAIAPNLANTSGKYFVECKEKEPAKRALDMDVANRLWLTSEKIVETYLPADKSY
ncbi:retinol dehydrogenase 13-like [Plodia interpunctella]|uniref:retinol dehydrogenase 13-like n=1 Tax=Plodia interpunctella TaxID=58824 RepID=UPI0023678BA9|nr:retinol dehydrogenase 13-like [Plodia interpunctella]